MIQLIASLIATPLLAIAILMIISHHNNRFDQVENAAIPSRLAALYKPRAPVVTGPVLIPDVFTWVVRKQPDGRFSVLPMTKQGIEMWDLAIAHDMPDSLEAWDIRNREQRAIGK